MRVIVPASLALGRRLCGAAATLRTGTGRNGTGEPMGTADEQVPGRVAEKVAGLAGVPVDEHGVGWKPSRWERDDLEPLRDAVEQVVAASEDRGDGWRTVRRRHVLALAPPAADVRAFFVAPMAWGYGDRAYGPARVARILRVFASTGPTRWPRT